MGYESKIIIVDRKAYDQENGNTWVYGDEVARFDLCKMGYAIFNYKRFRDLFTVPVDFDLYVNREDPNANYDPEYFRQDCYGEHCKYTTDIDSVIFWLEQSEKNDPYRRAKLFLDFLRVLKENAKDFNELCLVHYGY
jgi:hypothetical protein